MRPLEPRHRTPRSAHREKIRIDAPRVLRVPHDIVALDSPVGHLRVKVLGEAQRRAGIHVGHGIPRRVGPFVDGMAGRRLGRGIRVLPPDGRRVLRVDQHRVRRGVGAPAEAPDARVRVHAAPRVLPEPLVLPFVPPVLLERRRIARVPQVHAVRVGVERDRVVLAVARRELGRVRVAVVVAVPACLQADVRRRVDG